LSSDGSVQLLLTSGDQIPGIWNGQNWNSPWFSVLVVHFHSRKQRIVVWQHRQQAADYRRLRVLCLHFLPPDERPAKDPMFQP
jgi:hypothetical protein